MIEFFRDKKNKKLQEQINELKNSAGGGDDEDGI